MMFQYGDIFLVHGDGFMSDAIQTFTGSFYSHTALTAEPDLIVEMNRHGFYYGKNHYLKGDRAYVVLRHQLLMSPGETGAAVIFRAMEGAVNHLKTNTPKYDYFEVLLMAAKILADKGKSFIRNNDSFYSLAGLLETGERLICSALVVYIYQCAGIELFPGKSHREITPGDIMSLTAGKNAPLKVTYKYLPLK